jgi:hypothetical protein
MTKRLVVPFLVIGMGLWGCSSSSTKNDAAPTGGTGGTAGTGGTSGAGGTSGTGGTAGTGGTGGARLDGAMPDAPRMDTAPAADAGDGPRAEAGEAGNADTGAVDTGAVDTGGVAADFCTGYVMNQTVLTPAPAAAFCAKYNQVCMYGPAAPKYADLADCMMRYGMASDMGACRTNHLCNANLPGLAGQHCPHTQGGAAAGPCAQF